MSSRHRPYRSFSRCRSQSRRAEAQALPELAPIDMHFLEGVAWRALAGDRDAVDTLACELRVEMVAHAHAHLARFDVDAEDVVDELLLSMLEGTLPMPARGESAVLWILREVASLAAAGE
ncbi:MAG TPA: hypothetical protein VF765_34850 [Polyangiaceae bacterium]